MRKGLEAVWGVLLALIVLAVTFVIYYGITHGMFLQVGGLEHQQISAIGELPCTKSPTVQLAEDMDGVIYINASKTLAEYLKGGGQIIVPTLLNASISSSCFENLTVDWNFGDGQSIEAECSYVTGKGYATWNETGKDWTNENCTYVNHEYTRLSIGDIWTSKAISVSAFGSRSGFYSEASANGFVLDPFFSVRIWAPYVNNFNCVSFLSSVSNISGSMPLEQVSIDVLDNKKPISVDQQDTSKGISYRAPIGTSSSHTVQVLATKGYQTVKSDVLSYYAPSVSNPPEEIAVFGKTAVNIYTTASKVYDILGEFFPQKIGNPADMAVGKLSGDNAGANFVFLTTDGGKGSIFVQSYSGLKSSLSSSFSNADASQVKLSWPYYDLDELKKIYDGDFNSPGWKAVAAGKNIKSSDKSKTGNIVTLGNPGDLDLYSYVNGQITQVERGTGFKDFIHQGNGWQAALNDWQDIATADLDNDGESEIIAIRSYYDDTGGVTYSTHDLYAFKYANYKDIDVNKAPYYQNIPELKTKYSPWFAVAAGNMDKTEYAGVDPVEIIVLGKPGDLYKVEYFPGSENPFSLGYHKTDWPDTDWRDVAAIDYNSDGVDELAFLYKDNSKYYAALISYSNALNVTSFDDFKIKAIKINELSSTTNWQAIAAGDIACFL